MLMCRGSGRDQSGRKLHRKTGGRYPTRRAINRATCANVRQQICEVTEAFTAGESLPYWRITRSRSPRRWHNTLDVAAYSALIWVVRDATSRSTWSSYSTHNDEPRRWPAPLELNELRCRNWILWSGLLASIIGQAVRADQQVLSGSGTPTRSEPGSRCNAWRTCGHSCTSGGEEACHMTDF